MSFSLEDYVDVKTRIQIFWSRYPNGRIETSGPFLMPGREDMVIMRAEIYADKTDEKPLATGTAAELIHGKTPYTKDSEVMNCESSAIGRACGAANIGISKGMASLNEVVRAAELEEARKPKPEPKPVAEPTVQLDAWGNPMANNLIPTCDHGPREFKTGTGKTGKPYSGWVCTHQPREEQCQALWD